LRRGQALPCLSLEGKSAVRFREPRKRTQCDHNRGLGPSELTFVSALEPEFGASHMLMSNKWPRLQFDEGDCWLVGVSSMQETFRRISATPRCWSRGDDTCSRWRKFKRDILSECCSAREEIRAALQKCLAGWRVGRNAPEPLRGTHSDVLAATLSSAQQLVTSGVE
jgi:hypothetical protein